MANAEFDGGPDGDVTIRRITETGNDTLTLVFSEDCWVEISDMNRVRLFASLGRAGQELVFLGSGPFRLKLGYAPGVLLRYNSLPIALAQHTRRDVANLVVGR